ncbi:MAG: hypothetical protein ACRD2K_03825 [Terriglobales bacterium]
MPNLRIATFDFRTADLTGGGGSETRMAGPIDFSPPSEHLFMMVLGWAQVLLNAGMTSRTPRGRGPAVSPISNSPLVGEGNAEAIQTAVGSVEPVFIMVGETRTSLGAMQYNYTIDSAGGTYTARQSCGLVLCFE